MTAVMTVGVELPTTAFEAEPRAPVLSKPQAYLTTSKQVQRIPEPVLYKKQSDEKNGSNHFQQPLLRVCQRQLTFGMHMEHVNVEILQCTTRISQVSSASTAAISPKATIAAACSFAHEYRQEILDEVFDWLWPLEIDSFEQIA